MLEFLGRLHLVFLHLPIGILLLAGALAAFSFWKKTDDYRPTLDLTVGLGALAAIFSAIFGWLLAQNGGYDEALLMRHQWLGFASAALASATWLLRRSRWYFPVLAATVGAVSVAGHFGGSLTHGEGYLFQKIENEKVAAVDLENATAYEASIQPIFAKKCVSCHNPQKRKGELLLDSPENILEGGKHGAVIVAGSPDSSELFRRITLPSHDDDHMPPQGKRQLTPEEIDVVKQWIALGADFSAPASALQLPENSVAQIPTFPPVQVEFTDTDDLDLLRKNRISVMSFGENLPWLSVSLAGKKDLNEAKMDLLKKVGKQVVHLDLSHSNADNRLLAVLKNLPHLTRLNLSNTAATSEGLKNLTGAQFLDYLNLTNTTVGDEAVETLAKLPALRSLFVWNSRFSPTGLERMRAQLPAVQIFTGTPADTSAAPLQLRPPKILFARNIFEDTVQVALDFPFKTVSLFYTLDQASPTTQSHLYKGEPLVFQESTTLRAIAAKEGWENSPIVQASFVKRKWTPKTATLAAPPSSKYPGEGARSLIDGKIGETPAEKTFLGYEGEHLTAVLDFGEKIDFHRLSVHFVENNGSWIFAPQGLQVWISDDGKTWQPCIRARYPVPAAMQENKAGIVSEAAPKAVETRFLKVRVENLLKNPKWHSSAGQKCWVFVDEILVE
jgi:mono/diheme cytochrome c family protein